MRVSVQDFEVMREAIAPFDTPERRARYLVGHFLHYGTITDLDRKYRWDLLNTASIVSPVVETVCLRFNRPFLSWAGQSQGDTEDMDDALRRIVPPLKGNDHE